MCSFETGPQTTRLTSLPSERRRARNHKIWPSTFGWGAIFGWMTTCFVLMHLSQVAIAFLFSGTQSRSFDRVLFVLFVCAQMQCVGGGEVGLCMAVFWRGRLCWQGRSETRGQEHRPRTDRTPLSDFRCADFRFRCCRFLKTKLCWFDAQHPDGCPKSQSSCPFAHSAEELKTREPQTFQDDTTPTHS